MSRRGGGHADSDSGAEADSQEGPSGDEEEGPFKSHEKGASVARAFAKVLEKAGGDLPGAAILSVS